MAMDVADSEILRLDHNARTDDSGQAQRQTGRIRRRVARFRQAGLLSIHGQSTEVVRAKTADELCQAYQLVHDVFVYQGYIQPQPGGMRLRPFEALPEMATFVAKCGDKVVGVMSVVPDSSDLGLPADQCFHAELDQLRTMGRRIGEVTNLAVAPEFRNSSIFLELSRCITAHALNIGLDDLYICISPGHAMFFETLITFEPWGDTRSYSTDTNDEVEGKRLDLRRFEQRLLDVDAALGDQAFLHHWFFADNFNFDYTKTTDRLAAACFCNPVLLRELFVVRSSLLAQISPHILHALRKRWGDQTFFRVYSTVRGNTFTHR